MNKNKYILTYCPNFYRIINFEYFKEDLITDKLINIYRSYIFNIDINNKSELSKIGELDFVLSKYLDDYYFRRELKNRFPYIEFVTTENIVETFVNNILNIYDKYLEGTTKRIYISKWI